MFRYSISYKLGPGSNMTCPRIKWCTRGQCLLCGTGTDDNEEDEDEDENDSVMIVVIDHDIPIAIASPSFQS